MKPISLKNLIKSSRNFRNDEAIKRLAQYDSVREWSGNKVSPAFPEFYPEKPKRSIGLYNFFKSSVLLLKQLTP